MACELTVGHTRSIKAWTIADRPQLQSTSGATFGPASVAPPVYSALAKFTAMTCSKLAHLR